MKSKQLANVLIKMLGLSVCLYAIPSSVAGILMGLKQIMTTNEHIEALRITSYAVGAGVQLVIGITIIAMSQTVAGWMFKDDE